jgi:predicted transcriptional regulator
MIDNYSACVMSRITTQNGAYMTDLFAGLISSKTRISLLVRFFFNPGTKAYLRELSKDLHVSSNAVREELNQLTKTKLLTSEKEGRNVLYTANNDHPLS